MAEDPWERYYRVERRIDRFFSTPLWVLHVGVAAGLGVALALLGVWPSSPWWLVTARSLVLCIGGEVTAYIVYQRRHDRG